MKGFALLLSAVLTAIGIGVGMVAATEGPSSPGMTASALDGRQQVGDLSLAGGRSSASFTITAISPPTHTYDVLVQTAASADLRVHIHTWYGTSLGVQYATRGTPASNCKVAKAHMTCLSHFPELATERSGRWDVIASKTSGPPVAVRIAVTFMRASDGDE